MSTSIKPVVADQQVSMRRSASASMSSACLGTKRSPRHRSRARRHNNDSSAARRAAGHAHPHAREHGASQVQAAIDVAANQELLRPAPLELDSLRVSRSCSGAQVGVGGRRRAAGVRERVGESFLPCCGGRRCRRQRQRLLGRRTRRGRRRACCPLLRRGKAGLNRRVFVISGAPIVFEQCLAVVASPLDERLHHEAVDPAHGVGRNLRGQHLADPIVIRLDPFRRAAAANEVGGPEHRHKRLPLAGDPARIANELGRHRPAADHERLEESLPFRGSARTRSSSISANVIRLSSGPVRCEVTRPAVAAGTDCHLPRGRSSETLRR